MQNAGTYAIGDLSLESSPRAATTVRIGIPAKPLPEPAAAGGQ
jgi:hypothetical protein